MLTIEELKSLEAGDWVYTIYIKSNIRQYHCIEKNESNRLLVQDRVCCLDFVGLNYTDYGTKWLAYKNKEEAEGQSITLPYLLCTSSKFACVIWRDLDGKVKKTYTMPMHEAKGVLEEKRRIQWKD